MPIKIPSLNDSTMPNLPHFRNWEISDTCEIMVSNQNLPGRDVPALKLFPNPTSGILNIELLQDLPAVISLSDAYGKLVYRGDLENSSNTLDLSGLANGLYFVKVQSDSARAYTSKILLLK